MVALIVAADRGDEDFVVGHALDGGSGEGEEGAGDKELVIAVHGGVEWADCEGIAGGVGEELWVDCESYLLGMLIFHYLWMFYLRVRTEVVLMGREALK
jgi:hypothetical protein